MIKVKHPLGKNNQQQEARLADCTEQEKRFQELMFSYGNATYQYHHLAKEPTLIDYNEWLEGLPSDIRKHMAAKGFDSCRSVLSFTRYINEKNDVGMESFIKSMMGDEYEEYKKLLL